MSATTEDKGFQVGDVWLGSDGSRQTCTQADRPNGTAKFRPGFWDGHYGYVFKSFLPNGKQPQGYNNHTIDRLIERDGKAVGEPATEAGQPFEVAMAGLARGEKWRRPCWNPDCYIAWKNGMLRWHDSDQYAVLTDGAPEATDWQRVPDPKPEPREVWLADLTKPGGSTWFSQVDKNYPGARKFVEVV